MNAPARLSIFFGIVLAMSAALSSRTPPQQNTGSAPPAGVHTIGEPGLRPPRVLREVKPQYTVNAMRAKIEGTVLLEAVVDVDGHVGAIRVVRSLDEQNGLDGEAVRALEQWTFTPGMKDNVAVPVRISVQLSFGFSAPLTLPPAFVPRADAQASAGAAGDVWQAASVDDSGMRINVSYPAGWSAMTSPTPARLLRVERLRGRATDEFQITPLKPAPPGLNLNASMNRDKLQQFAALITQTLAQHDGTLKGSGQTRLGNRFWVWAEVHGPATDSGRNDLDVYMFSTTEADRMLQIGCSVLMPAGSSSDETAAAIQSASPVFVEMLRRLTIEPLSR